MDPLKTDAAPSLPTRARTAATRTPAELRAAETTRIAREMIDAATEKRHAAVAKLRAARLAKEAADRAAAPEPKKGRKRG